MLQKKKPPLKCWTHSTPPSHCHSDINNFNVDADKLYFQFLRWVVIFYKSILLQATDSVESINQFLEVCIEKDNGNIYHFIAFVTIAIVLDLSDKYHFFPNKN